MTVGADPKEVPRGFDTQHILRPQFETFWEKYFKYHTFEHDEEWNVSQSEVPSAPLDGKD